MKKILLFNSEISTDGISKLLSSITENISSDFNVEIMTYIIKKDIFFKDGSIKIHEIGTTKNIFKRIRKEKEIIKKGNYDIVHINGNYWLRIFDCIAAKKAGVRKVIIHSHNSNAGNSSSIKNIIHKLLKKLFDYVATDYYTCSDKAAEWMFSKKICNNKQYTLIRNGVEINRFKFNNEIRTKLRKELKVDRKFVIGHIGRFQYQKNHDFLIDIFKKCKNIRKNSVLLLIGEGPLEESIKQKVRDLNLEDSVLFLGNKRDAYNYYNVMDCFVLPSYFEGLPIVCVESQANGVPTIISDSITKQVKINNDLKSISLNEKPQKWAEVILKSKSKDRENAYKSVVKHRFDIKSVVLDLEKQYNK